MNQCPAVGRSPLVPPEFLEVDLGVGIRAGFTTRVGGLSPSPWDSLNLAHNVQDNLERVRANRHRASQLLSAAIAFATQVHGNQVLDLDLLLPLGSPPMPHAEPSTSTQARSLSLEPQAPPPILASPPTGAEAAQLCHQTAPPSSEMPDSVGTGDSLITGVPGRGLGVLVADCVPVLLAAPANGDRGGLVATAHAGRRGVELAVVSQTIVALVARGADPSQVRAAIGPAICGGCYEVPFAMQEQVCDLVPAARATTSWGTPALDLAKAVQAQLRASGVRYVIQVDRCTYTDHAFFSHRRATRCGEATTGRQAGIIALSPRGDQVHTGQKPGLISPV